MRQTGFAKSVERRNRAADAQHMETDEHGQGLRPFGKDMFNAQV